MLAEHQLTRTSATGTLAMLAFERMTIFCRNLDASLDTLTPALQYPKAEASERSPAGLYREMIVHDPDGTLVSLMQIDPLPGQPS